MKIVLYALLALLAANPVHAEWARQEYASEYESCLPSCDKNNPREHHQCVSYCRCVTDRMQAEFSSHQQLVREVTQQKLPERAARLQRLADHCNHEVWKSAARKLKSH